MSAPRVHWTNNAFAVGDIPPDVEPVTAARKPTAAERKLERQAKACEALLTWMLTRSERQHPWAVNE